MWCWHRVIQFLPWHRPWIAAMEGALVAAQEKLGYVNPIGLPFWDPVVPYKTLDGQDCWKNGHPYVKNLLFSQCLYGVSRPVPITNILKVVL
jgi:hypothetical protein